MTADPDIDSMFPGPEIDSRVAMDVMGAVCRGPARVHKMYLTEIRTVDEIYCDKCGRRWSLEGPVPLEAELTAPHATNGTPKYSREEAAALKVFDRLPANVLMSTINFGQTTVYLLEGDRVEVFASAPTRALAICRAALKAARQGPLPRE